MNLRKQLLLLTVLLGAILGGVAVDRAVSASGPFVEPEVDVIYTLTGDGGAGTFGWLAENLGDLNSDGVNDFIATAPFLNPGNAPGAGKLYIYSGQDGTLLKETTGNIRQVLGYSASRAGDVNNDGVPDYIAGAPGVDIVSVPLLVNGHAVVYSGADHSVIHDFVGAAGAAFGAGVATAGDVNGDGHDDLIVGAPFASDSFSQAGAVYVYSGRDGTLLWSRDGMSQGSLLGSAVGLVGDVNGDGVPDQVAGAQGGGKKGRGEAYVFSGATGDIIYTLQPVGLPGTPPTYGQFFAAGAGDINNDGVPDIFVGDYNARHGNTSGTGRAYVYSGADGGRLYVFNAENKGDGFGPGRAAGDVDGDGYDDLVIGAYTNSDGAPLGGKAYVYSGQDGSRLRTMTGAVANVNIGVDALAVGDITDDGLIDYILTGFGVVYVVAGNP